MPEIEITDPRTGVTKTVVLDGNQPPTNAEVEEIAAQLFGDTPKPAPRPAAAKPKPKSRSWGQQVLDAIPAKIEQTGRVLRRNPLLLTPPGMAMASAANAAKRGPNTSIGQALMRSPGEAVAFPVTMAKGIAAKAPGVAEDILTRNTAPIEAAGRAAIGDAKGAKRAIRRAVEANDRINETAASLAVPGYDAIKKGVTVGKQKGSVAAGFEATGQEIADQFLQNPVATVLDAIDVFGALPSAGALARANRPRVRPAAAPTSRRVTPKPISREAAEAAIAARAARRIARQAPNLDILDPDVATPIPEPLTPVAPRTFYHGTNAGETIRQEGFRVPSEADSPYMGDQWVRGVYLAEDPNLFGEGGALEGAADVLPVATTATRFAESTEFGAADLYRKYKIDPMAENAPDLLTRTLTNEGYEGLISRPPNGYPETVVFDPAKVRVADTPNTPTTPEPIPKQPFPWRGERIPLDPDLLDEAADSLAGVADEAVERTRADHDALMENIVSEQRKRDAQAGNAGVEPGSVSPLPAVVAGGDVASSGRVPGNERPLAQETAPVLPEAIRTASVGTQPEPTQAGVAGADATPLQAVAGQGIPGRVPAPEVAQRTNQPSQAFAQPPPTPPTGATRVDPDAPSPYLTGGRNSVVDAEREAMGMSPVQKQAYTTMPEAYTRGRAAIEAGEIDPRALATRVSAIPHNLSAVETGALIYDRARIIESHTEAVRRAAQAAESGDANAHATFAQSIKRLENELDVNGQALEKGGREWSAAGQARQMMIGEDLRLAPTLMEASANKGSRLTTEERARLERATADLEALQNRLSEVEANLAQAQQATPPRQGTNRAAKKKALDYTDDDRAKLDAARQRIREKASRLSSGIDPTLLLDYIEIGTVHARVLARAGVRTYKAWREEMAKDAPDLDEAGLQTVYAQSRVATATPAKGQQRSIPPPENVFVDLLSRRIGRKGASDFMSSVYVSSPDTLKKLVEGGKFTDAEETLLLVALQDASPAKPPAGNRATTPLAPLNQATSAARAREPRARNAPDPEAAYVRRLRKDIADLAEQARTGQAKVTAKQKRVYSEETQKLRAERDALKKQIGAADAFEKRVAAAEERLKREITKVETAIREKNLARPARNPKQPLTKEIADLQETLRTKRGELAEMRRVAEAEDTRNKAARTRLTKQLAELDRQLRERDFADPEKPEKPEYPDDVKELKLAIDRQKHKIRIEKEKLRPHTFGSVSVGMMQGNMLSSPRGVASDAFSTGVWLAWDNIVLRPATDLDAGSGFYAIRGLNRGTAPGIAEALDILRTGYGSRQAKNLDLPPKELPWKVFWLQNSVFRVRAALNEMQRVMAESAEALAESYQVATRDEGLSGDAARRRIEELYALTMDITDSVSVDPATAKLRDGIREKAVKYAREATFTQEADFVSRTVNQLRNKEIPGTGVKPGTVLVPFYNTMHNLVKTGVEHSALGVAWPGFNTVRKMMGKETFDNPALRRRAYVRAIFGTAITAALLPLALQGDMTGGVPTDPNERKRFWSEGKIPWAIRIGDRWVSYQMLGPLSVPMGMAGAFGQTYNHKLTEDEGGGVEGDILKSLAAFFRVPLEMLPITTLMQILSLDSKEIEKVIASYGRALVPGSAALNMVATATDEWGRKAEGVAAQVQRGLPYFRNKLPQAEYRNSQYGWRATLPIKIQDAANQ